MSFSENLKQIRKEHNLSQEELAELLDVSRQGENVMKDLKITSVNTQTQRQLLSAKQ